MENKVLDLTMVKEKLDPSQIREIGSDEKDAAVNNIKDVIDNAISCKSENVNQIDIKDEKNEHESEANNIVTDKMGNENTNQNNAAEHNEVKNHGTTSEDAISSANNKLNKLKENITSYQEPNITKNNQDLDISSVNEYCQVENNLKQFSCNFNKEVNVAVNSESKNLGDSPTKFDKMDVSETISNNENKENNIDYNANDNNLSKQEKLNVYSEDSTKTVGMEEILNVDKEGNNSGESSTKFNNMNVDETISNNDNKENNIDDNAKDNNLSKQEKLNVYSEDLTKTVAMEEILNVDKEGNNSGESSTKFDNMNVDETISNNENKENNIDYNAKDNNLSKQKKFNVYSEDSTKTVAMEEILNKEGNNLGESSTKIDNMDVDETISNNENKENNIDYNAKNHSNNNYLCKQEKQNVYSEDSNKTVAMEEVNQTTENCIDDAEINSHKSSKNEESLENNSYYLNEILKLKKVDRKVQQNNVEEKCEVKTDKNTPIIVNSKEILEASAKIIIPAVKLELSTMYECQRCSNVFLSQLHLYNHIIMRHLTATSVCLEKTEIYACDYDRCTRGFLTSYNYKIHIHSHAQEKMKKCIYLEIEDDKKFIKKYQCDECDQKFVLESTLEAHSVIHMPMEHVCHCGIGFYLLKDLVTHKAVVHPPSNEQNKKPVAWKPKIKLIKNEVIKPKVEKSKAKRKRVFHRTVVMKDNVTKYLYKSTEELERLRAIIPGKDGRYPCPDCTRTFQTTGALVNHYSKHSREPRPYACTFCDKTFTQPGAADLHMKRHTETKDFVCQVCNKGFYNNSSLKLHSRTHTGERPLLCSMCPRRFADPSALNRHLRTHTGNKIYQCESCPKRFSDASGLIMHSKRHKQQRDHNCDLCHKAFYSLTDLRTHRKRHNNQRDFKCDLCHKQFYTLHDMQDHRSMHSSEKKYECKYCWERFKRAGYLWVHIQRVHKSDGHRFECGHCGRTYANRYNFEAHLKEHYTTVYHCSICSRKFFSDSKFEEHKKTCPVKVFPCNVCEKTFIKEYSCKMHLMTHLEPTFECNECGRKFTYKRSLAEHIYTHMEKKHKCGRCQMKFVTIGDYNNHRNETCEWKKYKCKTCTMTFDHSVGLNKHRLKHLTSGYICDSCKTKYPKRKCLIAHIVTRLHNGKKIVCEPYQPCRNTIRKLRRK